MCRQDKFTDRKRSTTRFVFRFHIQWSRVYSCNDTPVYRYIAIFFATIRISYVEQAIVIFIIHLHMQQQTWESTVFDQCSPSFRFLVLMHGDFPNKLTRKIHAEQCLVLYSRWRTQQRGILLLCNVSYRVSYRDNCIGIRIVSWKNVSLQAQSTV